MLFWIGYFYRWWKFSWISGISRILWVSWIRYSLHHSERSKTKQTFIFNGEIKNTCIKGQLRPEPWCSTKVDVLEHYIRGEWGYCGESCSNSGNTTNCDWGPGPGFEKPGFGFLCIFAHFRPQKGNLGTRVLRLKNETCSNGKNPGFKPGSGTRAQSLLLKLVPEDLKNNIFF